LRCSARGRIRIRIRRGRIRNIRRRFRNRCRCGSHRSRCRCRCHRWRRCPRRLNRSRRCWLRRSARGYTRSNTHIGRSVHPLRRPCGGLQHRRSSWQRRRRRSRPGLGLCCRYCLRLTIGHGSTNLWLSRSCRGRWGRLRRRCRARRLRNRTRHRLLRSWSCGRIFLRVNLRLFGGRRYSRLSHTRRPRLQRPSRTVHRHHVRENVPNFSVGCLNLRKNKPIKNNLEPLSARHSAHYVLALSRFRKYLCLFRMARAIHESQVVSPSP
jgi:hypothetical protein